MSEHAFDLECESSGLLRVAYLVADLRLSLTAHKFAGHLRRIAKFNPYHDELGRFTTADGDAGAASDSAEGNVRVAQNDSLDGYPIDLREEENLGGHAIVEHIAASEKYLTSRVVQEASRAVEKGDDFEGLAIGSFKSLAAATKLVNSTVAQNADIVQQVVSGSRIIGVLDSHFSAPTGYEVYLPRYNSEPYARSTYGVRVVILPTNAAAKGFRVLTAFPTR